LVDPERRRRTVETVRCRLGHDRVSERRACRALGQPRSTQRYRPRRPDADRRLIEELRRLVAAYPRLRQRTCARVAGGHGLACERQAGAPAVEAGAPSGAPETAETPAFARKQRKQLPPPQSDAPQPRVELRLPGGPYRGRAAVEAAGGDRRVHAGMSGDRGGPDVHGPGRDPDLAVSVRGAGCAGARPQRQRTGIRGEGDSTLAGAGLGRYAVHPEGEPLGERVRGVVQRQTAG